MTQYNFTTNIEKRMPTTGEVFFVDRMTSDYAVQHPFDVDDYLEQVWQKWQDCETVGFRETREALSKVWTAVLSVSNPRGNAALYPNKNGEKHPALMEVWHKAGDYWRRGLRLGDVLPAVVPPCKITRTEDGWITLFPKDMHLLEQQADQPAKPETEMAAPAVEPAEQEQPEACPAVFPQEPQEEAPTPSPLAQMQAELEALRQENAHLSEELRVKSEEFSTARREAEALQYQREQEQEHQRRDQELQALTERELHRQLHRSRPRRISDGQRPDIDRPTDESAQPATARRNRRAVANSSFFTLHSSFPKPLSLAAASVVACIVIYETGLLIPMGLIGLAKSGLVK